MKLLILVAALYAETGQNTSPGGSSIYDRWNYQSVGAPQLRHIILPDTAKHVTNSTLSSNNTKRTFKQKMLAQYASNDTARAVINMFAKRQGGGALWLVTSGLYTARGLVAAQGAYSTTVNGVVVDEQDADITPVVLLGGLGAGYGVSKLARFSNGKLEKTLQEYSQGKPLPAWIRRRLKPKFFETPRKMNERK